MKKLRDMVDNHALLSRRLLLAIRGCDFLSVERWADPEGIADVIAADLMMDVSGLLDDCYFESSSLKVLECGDLFSNRAECERYIILSLMGSTAHILDLLDFEEKMITVQRDREYVVWGRIREED